MKITKMKNRMEWTKEIPDKEGFYWWRNKESKWKPEICKITKKGYVYWTGQDTPDFIDDLLTREFYGPLEVPK